MQSGMEFGYIGISYRVGVAAIFIVRPSINA